MLEVYIVLKCVRVRAGVCVCVFAASANVEVPFAI